MIDFNSSRVVMPSWMTDQLYVYETLQNPKGYMVNKAKGTTVSVRKRGGWGSSWSDAKVLAKWVVEG